MITPFQIETSEDGTVTVIPGEFHGKAYFTQWVTAALQANGFRRSGDNFVSSEPLAAHAARQIRGYGSDV